MHADGRRVVHCEARDVPSALVLRVADAAMPPAPPSPAVVPPPAAAKAQQRAVSGAAVSGSSALSVAERG